MARQVTAMTRRNWLRMASAAMAMSAASGTRAREATRTLEGRPGDFDFLTGAWTIHHRRPKASAPGGWDEFDGEATCWSILGGVGHIEELRIPARDFSGMGIRLLDPKTLLWNDYWVNGKSRELSGEPGLTGAFVDGVGTFTAEDTGSGARTIVRGVWDRITPTSHRWRQGASRDGGATWVEDWFMDWVRA